MWFPPFLSLFKHPQISIQQWRQVSRHTSHNPLYKRQPQPILTRHPHSPTRTKPPTTPPRSRSRRLPAATMVVALRPGKFYGGSLPRPRFYTDVKLNSDRVDPPSSVMDPLIQWANEAHWSMGGFSFKRLRLQGRIEGSVEKLRMQRERTFKKSMRQHKKSTKRPTSSVPEDDLEGRCEINKSTSPPSAPVAIKRRRVIGLVEEDGGEGEGPRKRGPRKLGDDFERVASEGAVDDNDCESGVSERNGATKQRRKLLKGGGKVGAAAGRTSPRLSRNRSN